jgi:hypothetical protein
VIVRLMGEGQFRVADDELERLNELDNQVVQAVEANDEQAVRRLLATMASAVREKGERLPDEALDPSDLVIPPDDLTLDEAHELFSGEGLIPDLPAPDAAGAAGSAA